MTEMFKLMGKIFASGCVYIILIYIHLTCCIVPKSYLDILLSPHIFKGYDLIVSINNDTEDNLVSWLQDSNNSFFSLTVAEANLSNTLEHMRTRSRSLDQIAIVIEYKNIRHLKSHMEMARQYSRMTTVPQPVFLVLISSPAVYEDFHKNEHKLAELSMEFSINSDFYLFGGGLPVNHNTEKKSSKKLNNLHVQGFSGHPLPDTYELSELYTLKNVTFFEPVDLGKTSLFQKVVRRNNFRATPIISVAQYGYFGGTSFSPDNKTFVSGYEVDQLEFFASSFNFTVVPKLGKGWIGVDSNNELTGMGKQLVNREADIAISSSEMITKRAAHLSFLHPTYYTTVWAFFKQPASNSLRDIFINAFTLDLWLIMFGTWLLLVFAMIGLGIVKSRLGTLQGPDKIVLQEVFIWAVGAICQQGWHVCPESGCMKIVFIFALITGLVSYVGYSAALVSILSVKVVPIKSLNDLINQRYAIYNDIQTLMTEDIVADLANQKLVPVSQRTIGGEEAINKILQSQATFLGVADLFYPVALKSLCSDLKVCQNIQKVSVSQNRPVQGGMFLRKRSSLTDFFNHRILLMYERGIRDRLMYNFFKDTSVLCLDLFASDKEPLGFNDVITAYVILGIGFMLSLTILVLEKLWATGLAKHHLSSQETNNAVALSSDETLRNIYQSQAPTVTVTQAD